MAGVVLQSLTSPSPRPDLAMASAARAILPSFWGLRIYARPRRISLALAVRAEATAKASVGRGSVACEAQDTALEAGNDVEDVSLAENKSYEDRILPGSVEVQSLLTTICDTTSIVEVKLNLAGFRLYVKRDLVEKSITPPAPSPPLIQTNTSNQAPDLNGSATATSLAISKPNVSSGGIQRIVDTASDEGLVILQSPKVGFFRKSRTIKGKRAPPSCKEKQEVKEGQVLCYIEQLGGEIPIESDVSGEVIKILRADGEPVGYGDALIAILPSFPGIKKLQ